MINQPEVDYTVLLVFAGFGAERESAETIVESALDWLNTNKDEPGFRFAPPVSAHLELVQDVDEARERLESNDSVALVILHDVPEDERDALLRDCEKQDVSACYTLDVPRPQGHREGPMQVVFRKKPIGRPPAHTLCAETLTAPVGEDRETADRAGEVIAVLALGVMQVHWKRHPTRYDFSQEPLP